MPDTLDINNVRAVFNSTGINFSDDYNGFFETPKGNINLTIDCKILWIAGPDSHEQMYLAEGIGASPGKYYYPGSHFSHPKSGFSCQYNGFGAFAGAYAGM
jgi:hypothetical protein